MDGANSGSALVSRVIEYIEEHLSETTDLTAIAGGVYYSKYHLHRLFTKTVGMTIHDYTQRRRLTEAAQLLVFSDAPILDISFYAGYESQQAFSAIFKTLYKMPPNQFRKNALFYPLQLPIRLKSGFSLPCIIPAQWEIAFAGNRDIPCWMELVRLVIDGFPCLYEEEYIQVIRDYIRQRRALIVKDNDIAVGVLLFSYDTGSINFWGIHPLYRKRGVPGAMLGRMMSDFLKDHNEISITTYREGDRADIGHRKTLKTLGFEERELLTEFGYPTQKFGICRKEKERFPSV
ncbi:MAG: AraC family transcriptional regulator [Spirochaetaceae bacterium]|jgi:AraC-like DNA-binding protein|nr:AraC family transcriptional regulator [Spirochaetaceae bacterium]